MADVNFNINFTGNTHETHEPTSNERQTFQNEIKKMSADDLATKLGDTNLADWQKNALLNELLNRLRDLIKNEKDEKEKTSLQDLLNELLGNKKGGGGGGGGGSQNNKMGQLVSQLLQALGVDKGTADHVGDSFNSNGDGKL